MPFKFNKELWTIGQTIENEALPKLNKYFKTDLQRDENNIWDILDFRDDEEKVIVEVKGRLIPSTQYADTIITSSKVMAGHQAIDDGYKVFFLFVFTDKSMIIELKEEQSFKVKFTGTNCIKHYCIPITELKDFDPDEEE
jgi:sulfur carrier protein ThiS|tara:strand:- start:59 stop:478 length:420 start_codon:yes stop_codon:yes gene_type:complete